MDETAFNAQLVTTRLKRGFCHLKSVDCRRSDVWKSFGLPMERMGILILLLVRLGFRRWVFSSFQTGATWEGLRDGAVRVRSVRVRSGSGQDFSNSCGAGAGLNFAGAGRERTQKIFNPRRTSA